MPAVLAPSRPALRRGTALAAVAASAVLGLAACGSASSGSGAPSSGASSSASVDAAAAALLPAKYKSGVTVASDVSYAPIEFKTDSGAITGFDYDLGQALGAKLGVPFRFTDVTFDGIIPQIQAGKYDLVMSAMTDNKKREATLSFVDYYTAGTSFVVKKGNPDNLTSLDGLCGKHVALEKGTTQDSVVTDASTACTQAGKQAVTVDSLPTDTAALLEVKSGKAVADINDSPVAAYIAEQSGGSLDSVLVQSLGTAPYGIGMLKSDTQLTQAVQAALKAVIADGTYAKILAKYGISDGSLTTATINGATS